MKLYLQLNKYKFIYQYNNHGGRQVHFSNEINNKLMMNVQDSPFQQLISAVMNSAHLATNQKTSLNGSIIQSASSNRIHQTANGGGMGSSQIQRQQSNPSRQLKPLPSASSQWQGSTQEQTMNSAMPISASVGPSNGIFTGQYNSQPLSGRSPMVSAKLGKLILGGRLGPHQVRSNFLRQHSPQMAYEVSHLVDDFELMKNVQNLIEENAHRCQDPSQQGRSGHQDQNKISVNEGGLMKEENLFVSGPPPPFEPYPKDNTNKMQSSMVYQDASVQSRQKSSNLRQSQQSRLRNESDSENLSHFRNSSACPQNGPRQEKKLLVQEYLNQNLFSQQQSEQDRGRYLDTLGKMLRQSHQDSSQPLFPAVQKSKDVYEDGVGERSSLNVQERLNSGMMDVYDNSILGYMNETGMQRTKQVKNMQRHNKFNFQRKNPAALYVQMTKQKERAAAQVSGPFGDLQLVGNQFQTKIFPVEMSTGMNLDSRRASNDLPSTDPKEMLLLLKRRQLDLSYREGPHRSGIKQRPEIDESLIQHQTMMRADMTANESTMKEIRESIKLDNHDVDSRQPQVGFQKSEKIFHTNRGRRFITAGAQQNNNLAKKSITNQTSKDQTSLINQLKAQNTIQNSRAKLKNLVPEKNESLTVGATTQDQSSLDQSDPLRKVSNRVTRGPTKRLYMIPSNGNTGMQIETEEEKMERILRLQKQIKAKYNDISKLKAKDEPYKFVIIRGNNSELVKRCLVEDRNGDWEEIPSTNTLFNFKWVPFSKGVRFDYLSVHGVKKMVNHFEFHDQITEKHSLFHNMQKLYESQKRNVFEDLPVTFTLDCGSASYFIELERFQIYFQLLEKHKSNPDAFNREILGHHLYPVSKKSNTKYTLSEEMFDGHNLWLLKPTDYNRGRGVQVFNSYDQFKRLIQEYQQGVEVKFNQPQQCLGGGQAGHKGHEGRKTNQPFGSNNTSCQITSLQDQVLTNFTNLESVPNIVKTNNFVIQKYLEKPLLLRKRKFDIRLWVLVAQDGKCYQFKEGYIRTSSVEYDTSPESLDKAFIHLTNNAVQKFNDNYGAFEEGNQLSLKQGSVQLRSQGIDLELSDVVYGPIQAIIKDTLRSVEAKLNPQGRKFCFEIFGYDFIIDQALKPWLIEVNTNPCLEESSSLLRVLIPRMVDDALKLTLDVVYPPRKRVKDCLSPNEKPEAIDIVICSEPGLGSGNAGAKEVQRVGESQIAMRQQSNDHERREATVQNQVSKYSVPGYADTENLWNLIYQLKV